MHPIHPPPSPHQQHTRPSLSPATHRTRAASTAAPQAANIPPGLSFQEAAQELARIVGGTLHAHMEASGLRLIVDGATCVPGCIQLLLALGGGRRGRQQAQRRQQDRGQLQQGHAAAAAPRGSSGGAASEGGTEDGEGGVEGEAEVLALNAALQELRVQLAAEGFEATVHLLSPVAAAGPPQHAVASQADAAPLVAAESPAARNAGAAAAGPCAEAAAAVQSLVYPSPVCLQRAEPPLTASPAAEPPAAAVNQVASLAQGATAPHGDSLTVTVSVLLPPAAWLWGAGWRCVRCVALPSGQGWLAPVVDMTLPLPVPGPGTATERAFEATVEVPAAWLGEPRGGSAGPTGVAAVFVHVLLGSSAGQEAAATASVQGGGQEGQGGGRPAVGEAHRGPEWVAAVVCVPVLGGAAADELCGAFARSCGGEAAGAAEGPLQRHAAAAAAYHKHVAPLVDAAMDAAQHHAAPPEPPGPPRSGGPAMRQPRGDGGAGAGAGATGWRVPWMGLYGRSIPSANSGDGGSGGGDGVTLTTDKVLVEAEEYRWYQSEQCRGADAWAVLSLSGCIVACCASAALAAMRDMGLKLVSALGVLVPPCVALAWLLLARPAVRLAARGPVLVCAVCHVWGASAVATLPGWPWADFGAAITGTRAVGHVLFLAVLSPAMYKLPSLRWQLFLNVISLPLLWFVLPVLIGRFASAPVPLPALVAIVTVSNVLVAAAGDISMRRRFVREQRLWQQQRGGAAAGVAASDATGGAGPGPSASKPKQA